MKLSVLDQSTAAQGVAQTVAIRETLELARHCEALGYHRYWVSEHHNSDSIVGTAPEVLMAAIAATTSRIRVGSAGVMLPHYSALKVAEQFRVLEGDRARPHRSRRRPRARVGPADRLCAQSARERRRRVSAPGPRASRVGIRRAARRRPSVRGDQGAPDRSDEPRALDPRQLRLWRAARRALRPAVCIRLFFQRRPRRRGSADAVSPQLPSERTTSGAAGDDLRVGARRGHRCRSAAPAADARVLARRIRAGDPQAAGVARVRRVIPVFGRRARDDSRRCGARRSSAPATHVAARLTELAERLALEELVVVTWTHDPAARHRSYELLAAAINPH